MAAARVGGDQLNPTTPGEVGVVQVEDQQRRPPALDPIEQGLVEFLFTDRIFNSRPRDAVEDLPGRFYNFQPAVYPLGRRLDLNSEHQVVDECDDQWIILVFFHRLDYTLIDVP